MTGVQTCALPISARRGEVGSREDGRGTTAGVLGQWGERASASEGKKGVDLGRGVAVGEGGLEASRGGDLILGVAAAWGGELVGRRPRARALGRPHSEDDAGGGAGPPGGLRPKGGAVASWANRPS